MDTKNELEAIQQAFAKMGEILSQVQYEPTPEQAEMDIKRWTCD